MLGQEISKRFSVVIKSATVMTFGGIFSLSCSQELVPAISDVERDAVCSIEKKFDGITVSDMSSFMRQYAVSNGLRYDEARYPVIPTIVFSLRGERYEIVGQNSFEREQYSIWVYNSGPSSDAYLAAVCGDLSKYIDSYTEGRE